MTRTLPAFDDHQVHLRSLREAALEAAHPSKAVLRALSLSGGDLIVAGRGLPLSGRLWLVAFGKAAAPMSLAAVEALHGRLTSALAAAPADSLGDLPPEFEAFAGGHPLPNEGSFAAGERLASLLAGATAADVVLVLVSGGGSAMLELPIPGVTLEDVRFLNELLLRSGLSIQQVNLVRSSLSRLKAGGLARLAAPARVAALVVSDVPGDDPGAVASGPTVATPNPRARAKALLRRSGLWESLSPSVQAALDSPEPARGRIPKPLTRIIASNRQAVGAAAKAARLLGFRVDRLGTPVQGEARLAGQRLAARLLRERRGTCLAAGGETTVTLEVSGRGGRNQELALQVALALEGESNLACMAFATDGIDGPTDAAGAIVTGSTAGDIRRRGLSPEASLDAHDSHPALDAAGALLHTGPTGTNVADIFIGLKY